MAALSSDLYRQARKMAQKCQSASNDQVAGAIFTAANLSSFVHEYAQTGTIENTIPSLLFIGASLLVTAHGKNEWACRAASLAGVAGLTILEQKGLKNADPSVVVGWLSYVTAQGLGIFRQPLKSYFGTCQNATLRCTLGTPDRVKSGIGLSSNVPLLKDAVARGDWAFASIVCAWLGAGVIQGMSTPVLRLGSKKQLALSASRPAKDKLGRSWTAQAPLTV